MDTGVPQVRRESAAFLIQVEWRLRRAQHAERDQRISERHVLTTEAAIIIACGWRCRAARAQCGRRRDMEGRAAAAVQAMVGMGHGVRGRAAARRLMEGVAIGRRWGKDGEVRHGQRGDDEEEEEEEGNEEEEEEEEDNYTRRVRRECGAFMVQAAWWGKQARQDMLQCQCAATLIARVWRGRRQQTR